MNQISIIGLGWLGLPLYYHLAKLGYLCKGSTTSISKRGKLTLEGVHCHLLELNENEIKGDIASCLQNCDTLILNTPPGLRRNPHGNYVGKMERLLPYIEKFKIKNVLFVSSTSVYEDTVEFQEISNSTLPNATSNVGSQIIKVEQLLQKNPHFSTTILRFAGLVDADRHPARMMSQRPQVRNAKAPVNLIHREDCINIISEIIKQNKWGEIYNAAYPMHVNKKEYYNRVCENLGFDTPNFVEDALSKGKLIDGAETVKELNTTYKYVI